MIEYVSFFKYLFITVALEIIVGLLIFNKKKHITTLLTILSMNLITNPTLNLFLKIVVEKTPRVSSDISDTISFKAAIFFGELAVLLIESLIIQKYLKVNKLRSFLSSLLLNFISIFLGQLFLNY